MKNHHHHIFNKRYLLAMLVLILASSCKKLIEIPENPPSQMTTAQVFSDSTNIISAVVGVYNNIGAASSGIGTSNVTLTGLSADELSTGQFTDPATAQFLTNTLLRDNYNINQYWTKCYSDLYQINACIEGLGNTTAISSGLKNKLLGEIRTVRAFYYFNLVNVFGAIPLVLSTDYTQTKSLPRAPVVQVYTQIISDLRQAEGLLDNTYPSAGRARVNLNVAKTLLAKVYLYQGNYANAVELSTEVISVDSYSLVNELNSVFLDGSNEAIWQLPANGLFSQTSDAQNFVPYSSGVVPNYPISDQLYHAFETGDQRMQKWIGLSQVDQDGSGTFTNYYYPNKYKNRELASVTTEGYMVFRLAELYLIRAEANAKQHQLENALADLKLIRNRAGLLESPASGETAVLEAVMHERQTELFCEWGNRWFDLKKSGKIDAVLGLVKPNWKPTAAWYPIPQQQMGLNPFLSQNTGY